MSTIAVTGRVRNITAIMKKGKTTNAVMGNTKRDTTVAAGTKGPSRL